MATSLGTLELTLTANSVKLQAEMLKSQQVAVAVGQAIAKELAKGVGGAEEAVRAKSGNVKAAFEAMFQGDFATAGKKIGDSVVNGIHSVIQASRNMLRDVVTGIFQGIGQSIFGMISGGIGSAMNMVGQAMNMQSFGGYDKARTELSTITDSTSQYQKVASNLTKNLGYQTNETEVLTASYDVLSSGFTKASDASNILSASIKASVGGSADLNNVTKAVTDTLNAYNLASDQSAKVANQIIGTHNAGKIAVSAYAGEIARLAPIAASAGIKLTELNSLIATSTGKGISPGTAFAGYAQAINAILKPTNDAMKITKELGVEFDATALKNKGFVGILQELHDKGAANAQTFTQLFGSIDAFQTLLPVVNDGFKTYNENMKQILSANVDESFKKQQNSMEGMRRTYENLKGELALKFQGAIAPAMEQGQRSLNDLMTRLTQSEGIWGAVNKAAQDFSHYLQQNPQIANAIENAIQKLVETSLKQAVDLTEKFLNYLQKNPDAVQQGIDKFNTMANSLISCVSQIGSMVKGVADFTAGLTNAIGKAVELAKTLGSAVMSAGEGALGALSGQYGQPTAPGSDSNGPVGAVGSIKPGNYAGYSVDDGKAKIASLITEVGKKRGASKRDMTIAMMVALDESDLQNLQDGDADSGGVFQQRPSQGWGSYKQVRDPNYAANKFYDSLLADPSRNNTSMPLAAQHIQRSFDSSGSNYAARQKVAEALINSSVQDGGPSGPMGPQMPSGGYSSGGYGGGGTGQPGKVMLHRTGQKDGNGLEILDVAVYDQAGKLAGDFSANSGIRSTQDRFGGANSNHAGSLAPVEYGKYKLGQEASSDNPGIGGAFIPVDPEFATERAGIGLHLDANRATSPGSAGCIVFATPQEFNAFRKTLRQSGASELIFEEGVRQRAGLNAMAGSTSSGYGGSLGGNDVGNNTNDPSQQFNLDLQKEKETQRVVEMARRGEDEGRRKQREFSLKAAEDKRETDKLSLQRRVDTAIDPNAKDQLGVDLQRADVTGKYDVNITRMKEERQDLVLGRNRKQADLKSKDPDTKEKAKYQPDYTGEIKRIDELIASQEKLRAQELANIGLAKETAAAEQIRKTAIEARHETTKAEMSLTEKQLKLAIAKADAENDPNTAKFLQFQLDRLSIRKQEYDTLQPLIDKYDELSRAIAENEKLKISKDNPGYKALLAERGLVQQKINTVKAGSADEYGIVDARVKGTTDTIARDNEKKRADFTEFQYSSDIALKKAQAGDMKRRGDIFGMSGNGGANATERAIAEDEENRRYTKELQANKEKVFDLTKSGVLSKDDAALALEKLNAAAAQTHQINLDGVKDQFKSLGSTIADTAKGAVGSFFKDLITGSKSAKDAFKGLIDSIVSKMADLAVNQALSGLFGGGKKGGGSAAGGGLASMFSLGGGSGGSGGGVGGLLGSLFGAFGGAFATGGTVGGNTSDTIGQAMAKEGPAATVIVASKDEEVLNQGDAAKYRKMFPSGIRNYATGGTVGGSSLNTSAPSPASRGGDIHVTVPVDASGGGGTGKPGDHQRLASALKSQILDTIRDERRPGGSLYA